MASDEENGACFFQNKIYKFHVNDYCYRGPLFYEEAVPERAEKS